MPPERRNQPSQNGISIGAKYLAAALLLGTLAAGGVQAADIPQLGWRLDGDALMRFGEGLETPYTRWANPSALGKLKVLFLANGNGAYDVPELARRLQMDVRGFPTQTWFRLGEWYWLWMWIEQSTGSERAAVLERMLDERVDVIVLANFRFASLNEANQYKILKQVAGGTGLVMFYKHDLDERLLQTPLAGGPQDLACGVPFAGLDFYRNWLMPSRDLITPDQIGPQLFKTYAFGKGRVLIVDYNEQPNIFASLPSAAVPMMEYNYTASVRYDYHLAMAARCLLWASGRRPRLTWSKPFPDGMEVEALSQPAPVRVRAAWTAEARPTFSRTLRLRNLWGDILLNEESVLVLDGDAMEWDLPLPAMPAGWHFVDCIVGTRDGVENWGSFSVNVRSRLSIQTIQPSAAFYKSGTPVAGQVVLSRQVTAGERAALEIWLEDSYGRVFSQARQDVAAGSDQASFELPQGNVASWGARLRVRLLIDGRAVHQKEVEIRLRRPGRGEYPIAMWGAIPGYGNHIGNLQMRQLGFTAVLSGNPLPQARDDIGWMTFGSGVGAIIHSLGDEIPVPRPGKGEVLNAFLKTRYSSLDALNQAWGTKFGSWEEVTPAYKASDGDAGSFVRLHDCLSAGEFQFADNIRKRREEIEKVNPPGVVGPEGSPVGDPELTLAQATFWGPYLTVRDNLLVNALGRPGVLRGNWFGGYVEDRRVPTRNRHVLWLSILGGNNMIEYFTIGGGLLAPDLSLMPFTEEFLPSWHQIRLGLGPQLARCRPAGNPVALLHSQASQHIGDAGGDSTDTIKAQEYLLNLLGDAGYSPQYVSTGQIRKGRLKEGAIKVLFLIHAFALSDEDITAIRTFAEAGGVVIADIPPAWFDEKCRLRPLRPMDQFFGITGPAPVASLENRRRLMDKADRVETQFGGMRLRGLEPQQPLSEPKDKAFLLSSSQGKGRSLLISGVLWKEGREDPETVQAFRRMLEEFGGVKPAFDVQYARPSPFAVTTGRRRRDGEASSSSPAWAIDKLGTKVYSYQRGDIWIDAVLPPEATDPSIPVRMTLRWPERRHTYDLRQSTSIGPPPPPVMEDPVYSGPGMQSRRRGEPPLPAPVVSTQKAVEAQAVDTIEQEVERSSPIVVARLLYKVASVSVTAPASATAGGVLQFTATVRDSENTSRPDHVIRVQIFGPDGQERPYYGAWLDADGPEQSGHIPFALNDPSGTWKLTVTDVISGTSTSRTFQLTK